MPKNRPFSPTPSEPKAHTAIDTARRVVHVAAVAIRNENGLVLTVRKEGTEGFMMPGGKPQAGETPLDTACREVAEELGITPAQERMRHLGVFEAAALNEAGFTVRAETFEYLPVGEELQELRAFTPRAEIAQVRWVDPAAGVGKQQNQAPLNTEYIFPTLVSRNTPAR